MPSSANKNLTTKQQREVRRAAKVAALKKKQALQKRNRRIGIIASITGGVAIIALIVTFVVTNPASTPTTGADPTPGASDAPIQGLTDFGTLTASHVDPGPVDYQAEYDMDPPAGGNHFQTLLNCGVYDQPQPNENAVHSLEHGAVWVTYDPGAVDAAGVAVLRAALPTTSSILSPYPNLPAPVVATAWGKQVQLDGPDDPRLALFVQNFWQSGAPEAGAPCTGGLNGPGKVG